jgi:hypothetical protein
MAKIKTSNQVQDELDKEFSWRLKEIAELRSAVDSSAVIRGNVLVRASIPLLYAHWEGFVKRSAEVYVEYVAHQKHRYKELQACFIVHGLKRRIHELSTSNNHTRNVELVKFLLSDLDESASVPYKDVVNVKSNLSSTVFCDIINSIGLDTEKYSTRFNFIDESVVKKRNLIAHGQNVDVDESRFREISEDVIVLLRMFKNDIENAVVTDAYTRDIS